MHMHKHSIAPIAAAVLLAFAGSAQAATKTANFGVSATVAANCLVSATNLGFGTYTGVAQLTGTSNVNVNCTKNSTYSLALSAGGGTYATRLLANGTNNLQYNLYTSAAATSIWGDGTASTAVVPGTGAGMAAANQITHTVYGVLPDNVTNETQPVGTYNDTITVTVTY
jgi:spore coat protein U-like protein